MEKYTTRKFESLTNCSLHIWPIPYFNFFFFFLYNAKFVHYTSFLHVFFVWAAHNFHDRIMHDLISNSDLYLEKKKKKNFMKVGPKCNLKTIHKKSDWQWCTIPNNTPPATSLKMSAVWVNTDIGLSHVANFFKPQLWKPRKCCLNLVSVAGAF